MPRPVGRSVVHRTSTRVLLSCAAIGVGGGLVAGASGYLAAAFAAFGPLLYGITAGTHFLPSVVALALLKRPGTAVLAGVIAGLVGAAFAPWWIGRFVGTGLLVGVLLELPFLITRYRRWDPWLFYVFGGVLGARAGHRRVHRPRRRALRVVGLGHRPAPLGRQPRVLHLDRPDHRGAAREGGCRTTAVAGDTAGLNLEPANRLRREERMPRGIRSSLLWRGDHTKWFARSRSSAKSISTA